MNLGFRGRLILGTFVSVLAVLLASGIWLQEQLESRLEQGIETKLSEHVRAVREFALSASHLVDISQADLLADRMGAALSLRVTIINGDGRVLGDSKLAPGDVASLENHGSRPECLAAQESNIGSARRYSATLQTDMLYMALRYKRSDGAGWVRVAMPLQELSDLERQIQSLLLVAAVLALFFALLLSSLASQVISRRLQRLVNNVRTLSSRAIESRTEPDTRDEFGLLAQSIDRMSEDLELVVKTLAQERDQFGAVLQGMQEAVIAFGRNLQITTINESAKQLFGLGEGLIGTPVNKVPSLAKLYPVLQPRMAHAVSDEFELDGIIAPTVLIRITPLAGSGGGVIVAHDVTEIRRLERVRQDFVANVSHELRTPVSVIHANSETLLDGALDDREQGPRFVEAIHRNAARLGSLVADLLDLSRIEAGQNVLDLEAIKLTGAGARAAEAIGISAGKKNTKVVNTIPEDLVALADFQALDQVLLNLVENAVKYTPEGGEVIVRAHDLDQRVRIEIEDDGPGVPAEHRDRLFERFYRVDPGRSKQMGGTGLGLAIVKHLVNTMDGNVGMAPAAKQGSIFWVELPKPN